MGEFDPRKMAQDGTVGLQGAFRAPGGSRRIADEGRILGAGPDGSEGIAGGVEPPPKVERAVAVLAGADDQDDFQFRKIGRDDFDLAQVVSIRDQGLGAAVGKPELERILPEQRKQGDRNQPRFPGGDVSESSLHRLR